MRSWKMILLIGLLCNCSTGFSMNRFTPHFAGAEHIAAGSKVKLHFTADDAGQVNPSLSLPNGLNLTYGEMVSLGDFYGIVGQPISSGPSDNERKSRFTTAFNTFAKAPAAVAEMPKILTILHGEQKALDDGMQRGEKPEDIYAKISGDNNRQFNCVTGGSCAPSVWWMIPGRYLQLAQKDFDHFSENAWIAYQTGHQVAIETALAAHESHDVQKLQLAYAMNAFACHFLSDRFASGHIRTPRAELPASVTPSIVGSLLSLFMHYEENEHGLHVNNLRGDHWGAYGDHYYYDSISDENRALLRESLQESADQVFAAYQQGNAPTEDNVAKWLPFASNDPSDIAPLFYWDSETHTLYRRTDIANVYDRHWTSNWWGWTTLIMLAQQRGLPTESQAQLVTAGYGDKALRYGLITDKDVLSYAKSTLRK
ncbi:MAG: hypothetical protein ACD_45C00396G0006 [uncultured bacterium]|nr:MAG: hypothetical protein ACD_45C00396G0006 [uncultured bacterium]